METVILAFLSAAVPKLINGIAPSLESKLPGITKTILNDAIGSNWVQNHIKQWEALGAEKLSEWFKTGIRDAEDFLRTHVHGALGNAIAAGLAAAADPSTHLTAQEVRALQVLKATSPTALDDALKYEFGLLGIAVPN